MADFGGNRERQSPTSASLFLNAAGGGGEAEIANSSGQTGIIANGDPPSARRSTAFLRSRSLWKFGIGARRYSGRVTGVTGLRKWRMDFAQTAAKTMGAVFARSRKAILY
jgi:hypothetical protein